MTLILRVLALFGSLSSAIDRLVGRLLGFLPFRVPGALLVALLLGVAAGAFVQDTNDAIAARPRPSETTVSALVERSSSAWVSVTGILSGPHLDNSVYAGDRDEHVVRIRDDPHDHVDEGGGEPVLDPGPRQTTFVLIPGDGLTRWFYVLRDLERTDRGLVVRSARDTGEIRTRSVVVTATGTLHGLPHLVELADARAEPATGSLTGLEEGERKTVRGAFTEGGELPCDAGDACPYGAIWRYLVTDAADPAISAWIDSPYPPDGLLVTLSGVLATDPARMEIVLATAEMRAALDGLRHPDTLVLADGIGPMLPSVTYLWAVVFAIMAAVVMLSAIIRYPVFRGDHAPSPAGLARPVVGELIEVEVDGKLPGASGAQRLRGAPARIGWLPARELVRRAWHLRSPLPDATDERPRLVLMALEGNLVLILGPIREPLRVEPGTIATAATVRPGLRLSGPGLRATLAFAFVRDRDRALHELDSATVPPSAGPIPEVDREPAAVPPRWTRPAVAAAQMGTALLAFGGAVVGLVTGRSEQVGIVIALLAASALAALGLGVIRGSPLADELLPSVALVGLVVAGVMAFASTGCGTWLSPNVADCEEVSPVTPGAAVAAAIAFAFSLWAVPRLSRARAPRSGSPRTGSR